MDDVPELYEARWQQAEHDHHGQANVESPERAFDPRLDPGPLRVGHILAQGIDAQAQSQEAEHTEQCGVAMVGSQIGADLEIADDRHVDQEAEHSGTHKIPEAYGHEEIKHPGVAAGNSLRSAGARHPDEAPSFETQQNQRHDLKSREARRNGHVEDALSFEIPVMAGADDSSHEGQDGFEDDDLDGLLTAHDTHFHKHQCHHDRGECLEESFHPKMDHPEAPGVNDSIVRHVVKEYGGDIEYGHAYREYQEEPAEKSLARHFEGRQCVAYDDVGPYEESHDHQQLESAPHLHIFPALTAEPEGAVAVAPQADQPGPLGQQRAEDHHSERTEQEICELYKTFPLFASEDARYDEAADDEACGHPEDGELDVPCPDELARENGREIKPVEGAGIGAVMGHGAAHKSLGEQQQSDHHHELQQASDRGRLLSVGAHHRERWHGCLPVALLVASHEVHACADTDQQEEQRSHAPDRQRIRRPLADDRLIGEIVCI